MIENLAQLVNRDPAILRWGRGMSETFMVEVGETQFLLTVRDGRVARAGSQVLRPLLKPLLTALFAVLADPEHRENDYVMKGTQCIGAALTSRCL